VAGGSRLPRIIGLDCGAHVTGIDTVLRASTDSKHSDCPMRVMLQRAFLSAPVTGLLNVQYCSDADFPQG